MIIFFSAIILVFILVWIAGFLYSNDFTVHSKSIPKDVKKALVIFPHADDEALTAGGFLSQLAKSGAKVDWVILTKGEKGNENATYDEALKHVRIGEAKKAAEIYKIKEIIQKEYPDNGVEEYKEKLTDELRNIIDKRKPDLILTYDLAGLYGHPDHMIASEVITSLVKKEFSDTSLWYASYPKRLLEMVQLPEHMANNTNFKEKRSYPTRRVWVGLHGIANKINAAYSYKSQRQSYVRSLPIKQIPLWFYISLMPFEYFSEGK